MTYFFKLFFCRVVFCLLHNSSGHYNDACYSCLDHCKYRVSQKKVYSRKFIRIKKWSSVMTYVFQALFMKCLCRFVQNFKSLHYVLLEL